MGVSIKKIEISIPLSDQLILRSRSDSSDGSFDYYLITAFDENIWNFHLVSVDDRKAYDGEVSERELRLLAAESPVATFDLYLSDTEHAFGLKESASEQTFQYFLKTDTGTVLFEWKKNISSGMRIQLGELKVREKDFEMALNDVFNIASLSMIESRLKISELEAVAEKKEREKTATQSVLDETLQMKSNLETDLYSKFTKVLNSKKEKIRELHAEIEKLKRPQKPKEAVPVQRTKKRIHSGAKKDDDDDVEMLDDDIHKPGPSRTREKDSQDSLLLSSDEEEKVAKPIAKPRQRTRQQAMVKKTVSNGYGVAGTSRVSKKAVIEDSYEDVDGLFDDL